MSAHPQPRGFTLVELMVGLAIMAIVVTAALQMLIENQRSFVQHADVAQVQSSLRQASSHLERSLLRAGYGMDPNFAIEPRVVGATGVEGAVRDGSGPFGSDELVVQYADPNFQRKATNVTSASLELDRVLSASDSMPAGQRLLVMCPDGSDWAYVVAGNVAGTSVTLVDGDFPFNERSRLSNACFGFGNSVVRRVERRHFFIGFFQDDAGPRPALLQNRGVDVAGDGTSNEMPAGWPDIITDLQDAEVLALDIEQLQVAYIINRPNPTLAALYAIGNGPDSGNANFIFGDDPSAQGEAPSADNPAWVGGSAAPNPLAPPPLRAEGCRDLMDGDSHCAYGSKRRYTSHPGNIRGVRFTLGGRSPREDAAIEETNALTDGPLENLVDSETGPTRFGVRSLQTALTRHKRTRLQTTLTLRNMFQRKLFLPPADNIDGG